MNKSKALILIVIVLTITVISTSTALAADSGAIDTAGEQTCMNLCAAKDYEGASECFKNFRDRGNAYLATAQCALNNYDDSDAVTYAIKAADEKKRWIQWIRRIPGVSSKIKTGGLAECYMLAYVASGGSYESQAISYAKTSGMCMDSPDRQACAEQYLQSKVAQFQTRTGITSRNSGSIESKGVSGQVTDAEGHPIKNAKVTLICGSKKKSKYLDENGRYSFTIKELEINNPLEICREGKLYVKLTYTDPKDNETKFIYKWNNKPVYFYKKFKLNSEADLTQNFQLTEGLPAASYGGEPSDLSQMDDWGISYYEMTRVYEYYRDVLKVDMKYKMPMDVFLFVAGAGSTHFSPAHSNSRIVIMEHDSDKNNSNRPRNREWHEFSHFIQYNNYGKWPQPPNPSAVPEINHMGYSNPNTADSFCEGFAEFMPLMIAKHYGEADWKNYASWGTLDKKIKTWQKYGRDEELAIAATFLDLVDPKDDDQVEIQFMDLWNIIKDYRQSMYVVYTAVKQKFPDQVAQIDAAYIENGFFNDKTNGTGKWEPKESWQNYDHDNVVDFNEPKIDYANETGLNKPWMIRQANEEPGYSANYQRPKRENTVKAPGNFIKTDSKWPYFTAKVTFNGNPEYNYEVRLDNIDGMTFFYVPGWENDADIVIEPAGIQHTSKLEFSVADFEDAGFTPVEQGYYVEHDFGIIGDHNPNENVMTQTLDDDIPYWDTKDQLADEEDYVYEYDEEFLDYEEGADLITADGTTFSSGETGGFPWKWILLAVVVLLVVWKLKKKKGRKSKHDDAEKPQKHNKKK
ncbi:carboxypeptidase regulatory-like domain-containing protein [Candidatus Woesearchaeota archaeon]|nr:carboxypeptidase regulatory-like domain-containing protein [Candidatus Woesearchaeota archaeon]